MSVYWSERALSVMPYTPGEQPRDTKLIKLNTNENPYPPSPMVREAILSQIDSLRLYPQSDGETLREAMTEYRGVPQDWVFVANGSDEALGFAFAAFTGPERVISMPTVTYSFYPTYADLFEAPYRPIRMAPGLKINVDAFPTDGPVVIANPNAPTSLALPLEDIKRLAEKLLREQQMLIVDEAYVEFGAETATPLLNDFPNLLIVGTLSKSHSLAGLRVGYALGQPHLIQGLERIKNSFNSYPLDRLAIVGGAAALRDVAHFERNRDAILRTRSWTSEHLADIGFEVMPSATNFLFVRFPGRSGEALFKHLRERGIVTRHFGRPEVADWLRITIGTDPDMVTVVRAMGEF